MGIEMDPMEARVRIKEQAAELNDIERTKDVLWKPMGNDISGRPIFKTPTGTYAFTRKDDGSLDRMERLGD
jgi:hypothetical protein